MTSYICQEESDLQEVNYPLSEKEMHVLIL